MNILNILNVLNEHIVLNVLNEHIEHIEHIECVSKPVNVDLGCWNTCPSWLFHEPTLWFQKHSAPFLNLNVFLGTMFYSLYYMKLAFISSKASLLGRVEVSPQYRCPESSLWVGPISVCLSAL